MANTKPYKEKVEKWFREQYLPSRHPGCMIEVGPTRLVWGGAFEYDARVLRSGTLDTVYCLSCSQYKTAGGKGGAGKFNKIQGDMLKMVGTDCPRRVMVFTGKTMLEKVQAEQKAGRLPPDIQCEHAELPSDLAALVQAIMAESSKEVTPKN
jgi:hypothetical protein